jgi:uncharacterized membrane protein YkoI
VDYIAIKRPITLALKPLISNEESLKIALKQFGNIKNVDSKLQLRIWYYEKNEQKLVWDCTIIGEPKEYVLQGGNVIIDATTGDVLKISRWL